MPSSYVFTLAWPEVYPLQGQTNFAVLANDGAWTWFNDPRALFNNGTLYFAYDRSPMARPS